MQLWKPGRLVRFEVASNGLPLGLRIHVRCCSWGYPAMCRDAVAGIGIHIWSLLGLCVRLKPKAPHPCCSELLLYLVLEISGTTVGCQYAQQCMRTV